MPTINYEIDKDPVYDRDNVTFSAKEKERGGFNTIRRTVNIETFDDFEAMARWLLQQDFDVVERSDKKAKFKIEYHFETVTGEDGNQVEVKVFDSVS